ncbi:hypothetical protein QF036_004822 [Arthrobacter globiformis]|nr:hypothetical protein [Arthrobacter globiformis]
MGKRQPDGSVLVQFAVDDGGAQLDGGTLQGIALLDGGYFICGGLVGHAASIAGGAWTGYVDSVTAAERNNPGSAVVVPNVPPRGWQLRKPLRKAVLP